MKKIAALGFLAMSAFAASWTGYISDAGCAAKHADGSEKSIGCVKACVTKKNAAPVFVVGDKVYKIDEASKAKVMDHLGHQVTLNGKLKDDTVTISKVKMPKAKK